MKEFELIERLFKPKYSKAEVGIGDDCAVLQPNPERLQTVCTDTMVKGTHYPQSDIDYEAVGFKLVAVNVSDTLAMGATPRWATLAISAQETFAFEAFSKGLAEALEHYQIELIGGDTTYGNETLTLTLLGESEKIVQRKGAQVGDVIALTGAVGLARAGLQYLQAGQKMPSPYEQAYWKPMPKLAWAPLIRRFATACIDVSDGLAQDLGHVLKASGSLGAQLEQAAFDEWHTLSPIAQRFQVDAWDWILRGGDDYQLCFTVSPGHQQSLGKMVQFAGLSVRFIGKVTSQSGIHFGEESVELSGYQHQF